MLDTLKVKGVAELTLLDSKGQAKQSVTTSNLVVDTGLNFIVDRMKDDETVMTHMSVGCLLYTSPSPRDGLLSRMPSSA